MIYQKIIKYILLSFVFVFLAGMVFLGVQWFSASVGSMVINRGNLQGSLESPFDSASAKQTQSIPSNLLPARNWQVSDLQSHAEAAVSIQISFGGAKILFNKNEDKKLPIASLTKLMTALVVFDRYDFSGRATISQQAMAQEGEQGDLKLGQNFSVKDLLYIMLMESSNRAAYALSETAGTDNFVALMNKRAALMGLSNTHFSDASGLADTSYSTAGDLAKLSQYIFENYPLFRQIISLKEYNVYLPDGTLHHTLQNTNQLLGQLGVMGGKTGYTQSAKGCVMEIQQVSGRYIVNVVLGSDDRFFDMQELMHWVAGAYQWQ